MKKQRWASHALPKKTQWLSIVVLTLATFVSLLAPVFQTQHTAALTNLEALRCYNDLNGKVISYNDTTGINYDGITLKEDQITACVEANICQEDRSAGMRSYTCTDPTAQQLKDLSAQAKLTETSKLNGVICKAGGSDAANTGCVTKVATTYTTCSSSGGPVTSAVQVSDQKTAECMHKTYPNIPTATLLAAITQGRADAQKLIANSTQDQCLAAQGYEWKDGKCSAKAAGASETNTCGYEGNVALNWLGCPVTSLMQQVASFFAGKIQELLFFPADQVFTSGTKANTGLRQAWSSFRYIALALVIITGLVMVISQALGLEILDAYTTRKLMPRLGIAMIGIALSWPLSNILVTLFNDLGSWARALILTPFSSMPVADSGPGNVAFNWGLFFIGGPAFIGYLYTIGLVGSLSLMGTIALAVFIGMIVLALRWVILAMCILFAPIAIASYVLPGTQKLWKFWKNTFITALMMFPIIMGFIAMGDVMARVATAINAKDYFFILLLYFGPYFLLPFAFKLAGGLMSTIFSMANDKSRGAFDRMRNYRKETGKRRWGKLADKSLGTQNGLVQRTLGTAARVSAIKDINHFSHAGRARFATESKKLVDATAKERAEKAPQNVSGDTDGNLIGLQARNRGDFISKYVQHKQNAGSLESRESLEEEARQKIAKLEGGYGADVGSHSFRRAALYSHVVLDNAAWDDVAGVQGQGETKQAFYDRQQAAKERVLRQLNADGIIEHDDYAGMERANKLRPDNIMGSFGQHDDYIRKVLSDGGISAGAREGANNNMYEEVAGSGATTSNKRSVERLAARMSKRLTASKSGNAAAIGTYTPEGGSPKNNLMGSGGIDTWTGEYAAAADIHEAQSYSGQGNAELYANVWKEEAFTEADLSSMSDDIKVEARKLLTAARSAGQKVTHQDVKTHLQGGIATFTDNLGVEHHAQPASANTVKKFTARKKEWSAAYQSQAGGRPQDPNQPVLPGMS